jgi:hypothetical protein
MEKGLTEAEREVVDPRLHKLDDEEHIEIDELLARLS